MSFTISFKYTKPKSSSSSTSSSTSSSSPSPSPSLLRSSQAKSHLPNAQATIKLISSNKIATFTDTYPSSSATSLDRLLNFSEINEESDLQWKDDAHDVVNTLKAWRILFKGLDQRKRQIRKEQRASPQTGSTLKQPQEAIESGGEDLRASESMEEDGASEREASQSQSEDSSSTKKKRRLTRTV